MGLKKTTIFVIIFWLFFIVSAAAEDIFNISISQAKVNIPKLKIYVNLLNENDDVIKELSSDEINFNVSIGEYSAEVEDVALFNKEQEGTAYIFLIDISKSLTEEEFSNIREIMSKCVDGMKGKDKIGIITFGEKVNLLTDFTNDKRILNEKINHLKPTDNKTLFYKAINQAINIGNIEDEKLPERRVIIMLSDGEDDFIGGITKEEIISKIEKNRIPIYSIGFYHKPLTQEKQKHLDELGEFARMSGGKYFQTGKKSINNIYSDIRERILNSFIITASCSGCKADGTLKHIKVELNDGSKKISSGLDVRVNVAYKTNGDTKKYEENIDNKEIKYYEKSNLSNILVSKKSIILLISCALVLIIIILLCIRKRNKYKKQIKQNSCIDKNNNLSSIANEFENKSLKGYKVKGKKIRLTVIGDSKKQKKYEIELIDKIILGRTKSQSDLTIEDNKISAEHCELILENNKVFIRDLNSTNGTYVNGIPISTKCSIENDDFLLIGNTEFRIRILEL